MKNNAKYDDQDYAEFHELADGLEREDIYELTMILLEHLSDDEIIKALDLTLNTQTKDHLSELWMPVKGITR